MNVIIIGGGISGLSSAHYLLSKGCEKGLEARISVIEASESWGGKIRTERVRGFVIEGGPDTFLATKPWGVRLCRELGIESRLQSTNPLQKNTFVLHKGRLEPLPDGLTMMVPTRFGPVIRSSLLSWPAKARMGMDFLLPAKPLDGDESLGDFVSRRLGRTAYERLIEPLMSGIYAGDGDKLSLKATFPYLRELELNYGGLVKGALATRKILSKNGKMAQGSRSAFLTPTTGLQEIIDALVGSLTSQGVSLRLSSEAISISSAPDGYRVELNTGENIEAKQVILATPAYKAGQLLKNLNPGLAADLEAIPYVSTATVSLAFRADDLPRPLNGYGYIIPRREGRRALACTWTSSKFPHRAPSGSALLRVFFGRAGEEGYLPKSQETLLEMAREELRDTLSVRAEPLITRVFYWERAMPQYNLGHLERVQRIEREIERLGGLALAGNGYHGIGIPDCIRSGEAAANQLIEQILK
jgi:oxygen-dependent protoporphyrinogen oxidase